jgi:hypothetical protein
LFSPLGVMGPPMKTHSRKPVGKTKFPSFVNTGPLCALDCESPMATIVNTAPKATANRSFIIHLSSGIAGLTCNIPA